MTAAGRRGSTEDAEALRRPFETRIDRFQLIAAGAWAIVGASFLVRGFSLGVIHLSAAAAMLVMRAWARRDLGRRAVQAAHVCIGLSLAAVVVLAFLTGQSSATAPWFVACIPLAAAYLLGVRATVAWLVASVAAIVLVDGWEMWAFVIPSAPLPRDMRSDHLTQHVVLVLLAVGFAVSARRIHDAQLAEAERRERTIAEQKAVVERQAAELAVARDTALEGARTKTAFLANMSHEIRTPLNAILGMTGVIEETELSTDQRECLATIHTSGDALLALLNDILDFSKIDAGKIDLELAPFDLARCVEDAIDLVAAPAAEKDVEVTYEVEAAAPGWVVSDMARARQVVVNLLSNAVKFTPAGDVRVVVDARRREGGWRVEMRIADEGIGIPAEKLARLFEPFSQVDASTTRQYGGTGLGLAICRTLARRLGGDVTVESAPGRGSTFCFAFDAAAVEPAELTGSAGDARDARAAEDLRIAEIVRGKRALVASAHPGVRRAVARWLLRAGAEVREVATLADVAPSGARSDVVILSVRGDDAEDDAMTRALRKAAREAPLVLLSPLGREARSLAVFPSASHAVARPLKRGRLLVAVARSVSRRGSSAPRLSSSGENRAATGTPLRVLLAEDNVVNQKVERRILERMGHKVDVVANGIEAIEAVRRRTYDVVLLDIQMPELDGIETARRLVAEWPAARRPRLVALTANATSSDRDACLSAGMDGYLCKPFRQAELEDALSDVPVNPRAASDGGASSADRAAIDYGVIAQLRELEATQPGLVNELFVAFLGDTPARLDVVASALSAGRTGDAVMDAHALKGAAGTLGLIRIAALAATVELAAKAGDAAAAKDAFERLRAELARIAPVLRELAGAGADAPPSSRRARSPG